MTLAAPAVTPADILAYVDLWGIQYIYPHGDRGIYMPTLIFRSSPKDWRYLFAIPVKDTTAWDVRVWRVITDDMNMRDLGVHIAITEPPAYSRIVEADMSVREKPFYYNSPGNPSPVPYYLNTFRDVMLGDTTDFDFSTLSLAEIINL